MLPHLVGRPATRKRWPEGVDKTSFFVKDLEAGTPGWLTRVQIRHGSGPKFYPVFDSPAALAWLGQVAALELHVPQWRIEQPAGPTVTSRSAERHPDRGGVRSGPRPWRRAGGMRGCRPGPAGTPRPARSTSRGRHQRQQGPSPVRADGPSDHHRGASEWARLAAEELQKALPSLVVSRMAKSLRTRKVLVDWSQNNRSKTTISPYSLRGRDQPWVAAPRTWAELTEPGLRQLDYREVLDRLTDGVDPLADLHRSPRVVAAAAGDTATRPARRPAIRVTSRPRPQPARRPAPPVTPAASSAGLPTDLTGPVELELARAVPTLPGPHAMQGGTRWELKSDGFRAAVVRGPDTVRIWSRNNDDFCRWSACCTIPCCHG